MSNLQFLPFTSSLDAGFWHALSTKKLDEYKLKDEPVSIYGCYSNTNAQGLAALFTLEYASFDRQGHHHPGQYVLEGTLVNTNTVDQFKTYDKSALIRTAGEKIWKSIMSGEALEDPKQLNTFSLLTFANLKKHQYHYWFAFPALCPQLPVEVAESNSSIDGILNPEQTREMLLQYDSQFKPDNVPYFAVYLNGEQSIKLLRLHEIIQPAHQLDQLVFVFVDPSTLAGHPGWTLRNFLCLIARHFVKEKCTIKLLGLRDRTVDGKRDISHSIYVRPLVSPLSPESVMWNVVGWEKNHQQKLLPRFVDMSRSMDPAHVAESAVDLNLKLMRWRLLPELDLASISKTKCLLLGAGTLGCNVARNLLGWGVRTITLVDNSTVSFSNPVRQSLFTFEHCKDGGLPKAETAAESLKLIFPGVNAKGVSLAIPMPGHPVTPNSAQAVQKDVEVLEALIEEHDAVFLLMDTRESRWLPSIIGAAKDKIVMTAALGFDTWLAMRHGRSVLVSEDVGDTVPTSKESISGTDLGCYYCNDVVAPRDSTKDRALDQQCTVSRPGLSMLCSALIVELFVSLLQHPLRGSAPAHLAADEDSQPDESILGALPHQIRGYLSQYQIVLPVGKKFDHCTACSAQVVKQYQHDGFEFLLRAFNDAKYLEEVSGLNSLLNDPADIEVLSDFDVDEDDW
ncbi:ubiquitin-like modifier-activating enzyme ATG7 isoform X1 [Watersipora subatra]|uniref:ubiquitin-like modifier-activating enzyme ATG7 isoform X1 n=1 Tax=Watersipora subatra TaxID=2589382 RepID=UPI00355BACDD